MLGASVTMDLLAGILAQRGDVGRTVRNSTSLSGAFDFELDYMPTAPLDPSNPNAAQTAADGPTLFTALKEQLGLRLDSRQGPVEVVVIDRVSRPTEN